MREQADILFCRVANFLKQTPWQRAMRRQLLAALSDPQRTVDTLRDAFHPADFPAISELEVTLQLFRLSPGAFQSCVVGAELGA